MSTARQAFLGGFEKVFPGGTAKWNARAASSLPALDPNLGASYSCWRVGRYTAFAEGSAAEGARAAREILDQLRGKKHRARPGPRRSTNAAFEALVAQGLGDQETS